MALVNSISLREEEVSIMASRDGGNTTKNARVAPNVLSGCESQSQAAPTPLMTPNRKRKLQ